MKVYDEKLQPLHGYLEGKSDALDPESMSKALDYKKNILKKFISLNPTQIESRLAGDKYYVTRKYDGEYAIIFYQNGETVTVNRSGRVRKGIPCIEEAGKLIAKAGIKQGIFPAEIYMDDTHRKNRVNDLISALADDKKIDRLKLAVYDIIELDDKPYKPISYKDTIDTLRNIFNDGQKCNVVDMQDANSALKVQEIYDKWVITEGSEGLVVRSDLPFVFKVKPRHSIDVVIIGFTEGTGSQKGSARTFLIALIPEEGKYQVVGKVGGGFSDKQKKDLFKQLTPLTISTDYIETDSNHVAFHMVTPQIIIQIGINDIITDTSSGPIYNALLELSSNGYTLLSTIEGFSFISPAFERFREDKHVDSSDLRVSQVDSFSNREIRSVQTDRPSEMPKSKMLVREVYTKSTGTKIMVQKYVIWKTNKQVSIDFPEYVLYYANFSTERKEPLQREIRISSSKEQLLTILEKMKDENLKKGWNPVEIGIKEPVLT